jgi:hypothetical protein
MLSSISTPKSFEQTSYSTNHNGTRFSIYEPLQSAQHIRLLRIKASSTTSGEQSSHEQSKSNKQEQYELVNVPLEACPTPFQAVSYAWGDNTQNYVLRLKGQQTLPITKTLAVALPYLARMCSTDHLWIDQICIDQTNIQERSQQVSMMGKIYSNATEVLIWTGEELGGFSELETQLAKPGRLDDCYVETLVQLICRPWFTRGWIVQEAVLGKTTTLIAGTSWLPLDDVGQAWSKPKFSVPARHRDAIHVGRTSIINIMALRKRKSVPDLEFGFDGLLNSFGDSQISDPRDHVYAFLGLKYDARIVIEPDYNASVGEVFTDTTRATIEGTGTLDCFRFLPRRDEFNSFNLPSWVPDWSRNNRNARILQDPVIETWYPHPHFTAAKKYCHKVKNIPQRADLLHVSGHVIDVVEFKLANINPHVYGTLRPGHGAQMPPRSHFFSLTDEQVTAVNEGALTDPTQNLRKRLMSVLVAGHFDAEEILAKYDDESQIDPGLDFELRFHLRRMSSHQIWVTRSKRLVLVPPDRCERGDVLAIVHGLNAPLLLRNIGDGTYAVGGQCYLENAMYGEEVTWEEDEADVLPLI